MAGIKINNLDIDIIRAWKDEEYRNSLSETQRAHLPENPAGMAEITDEEIDAVLGGLRPGPGWVPSITDDCPNSVFVCC